MRTDIRLMHNSMAGFTDCSRRSFIKQSLIVATGMALTPGALLAASKPEELIVLHTNDLHAHVEPFPESDPDHPGQGGLGHLSGMIKEMRTQHEHVLLVDAGDMFQGTPYYNRFGGGN